MFNYRDQLKKHGLGLVKFVPVYLITLPELACSIHTTWPKPFSRTLYNLPIYYHLVIALCGHGHWWKRPITLAAFCTERYGILAFPLGECTSEKFFTK